MDVRVLPVKDDITKKTKKKYHPHLPDINEGQVGILVSPIRTGKSTIISNFLLNDNFYRDAFDLVYILSQSITNDKTSRFLRKEFPDTIYDDLTNVDEIVDEIISYQNMFERAKMPKVAIICDDFIGVKGKKIFNLTSRSRHLNIKLMVFATQLFRSIPPVVRQNATFLIMGSPNNNSKEILKLAEEFSEIVGGEEKFLSLYKEATPARHNFLYIKLDSNPTEVYKNFTDLIYVHKDEYSGEKNGTGQDD
tara:strand:- start:228 stop:977 length:750 start_codon:yes stop_codon:yes gene_type:complete